MLEHIPLKNILFLDIETASQFETFDLAPKKIQDLWIKKAQYLRKENDTDDQLYRRAGIYAEFGKVICVSMGVLREVEGKIVLKVASLFDNDEKVLLEKLKKYFELFSKGTELYLCAHNGKEFDFPYIARRMLVNNIRLPHVLDVGGKKPWEVTFIDTMELWKFGDGKKFTSLELLTEIFGIDSPKDDIDGSMVNELYWKEKDLHRIKAYCENDVIALTQLFLRLNSHPFIDRENVQKINLEEK